MLSGILGTLGVIGVLLVLGAAGQVAPPDIVVLLLIGQALAVGALVVLYQGLGRADAWADRAMVRVCILLIVTGVFRVLLDASQSRVTIPLEAIGAAIVLAARPASGAMEPLDAAGERRATLILGALLVAQVVPLLAPAVG